MNDIAIYVQRAIAARDSSSEKLPMILKWKGSRVPRGELVYGVVIGYAANGILQDETGHQFASYTRSLEFSGPEKDEHEMMVTVWKNNRR